MTTPLQEWMERIENRVAQLELKEVAREQKTLAYIDMLKRQNEELMERVEQIRRERDAV